MSMWEIEALAEQSVAMIAESDLSQRDKRNAYASVYEATGGFDTSFTHFRNVRALTDAGFFLRIDVADHPEYQTRKADLDGLDRDTWLEHAEGFEALFVAKPTAGRPPGIWFDITMPLWKRAVAAGVVQGPAAEPFEIWPVAEMLVRLMTLAERSSRPRELKMLHGFAAMALPEATAEDPRLAPLLALPGLSAALRSQGERDGWIDERFDARQALQWCDAPQQRAFLEWWCAPYGGQ